MGTTVSGLVARFELDQAGAAGLLMSRTPKKFEPLPLNPGCVMMIFAPITAAVGGVQAPVLAGEVGVLPAVTPEIVTKTLLIRS